MTVKTIDELYKAVSNDVSPIKVTGQAKNELLSRMTLEYGNLRGQYIKKKESYLGFIPEMALLAVDMVHTFKGGKSRLNSGDNLAELIETYYNVQSNNYSYIMLVHIF